MTDQRFSKGDLVRKGNGKTVYRVIRVTPDYFDAGTVAAVQLCKSTTTVDPARSCIYRETELSAVTA